MVIKLNVEAVRQLNMIMSHAGYTNPVHCIQTMLSQVNKKIQLTKKAP